MTALEMRDLTSEQLGRIVGQFIKDYWGELVRVGGESEDGVAKCAFNISLSMVNPRTPHRASFRMPLGSIHETRIVELDDLLPMEPEEESLEAPEDIP